MRLAKSSHREKRVAIDKIYFSYKTFYDLLFFNSLSAKMSKGLILPI